MKTVMLAVALVAAGIHAAPAWAVSDGGDPARHRGGGIRLRRHRAANRRAAGGGHQPSGQSEPEPHRLAAELKAADPFARADPVIEDGVACDGWVDALLSGEDGARLTHEWVLKGSAESTLYDRLGRNTDAPRCDSPIRPPGDTLPAHALHPSASTAPSC